MEILHGPFNNFWTKAWIKSLLDRERDCTEKIAKHWLSWNEEICQDNHRMAKESYRVTTNKKSLANQSTGHFCGSQ